MTVQIDALTVQHVCYIAKTKGGHREEEGGYHALTLDTVSCIDKKKEGTRKQEIQGQQGTRRTK